MALAIVGPYRLNLFALIGGLFLALWTLESIVCNSALLRLRRVDTPLWATAVVLTVRAGLSGYAAVTFVLAEPPLLYSWAGGVSVGVLILAVQAGLSVAVGRLAASPTSEMTTKHDLTHNLIQDATLVLLLYFCAVLVPSLAWAHLPTGSVLGTWTHSFKVVGLLCMPLMMLFLLPFDWLLDNNFRHLEQETVSRGKDLVALRRILQSERPVWARNRLLWTAATHGLAGGEQERFLRVLGAHIRNQNRIACLVVSLSGFGVLVLMARGRALPLVPPLDRTGSAAGG